MLTKITKSGHSKVKVGNVDILVMKQGLLHKTKLAENGKRQRKNWSHYYVVLTDNFLLFFKDAKAFQTLQQSSSSSAGKDSTKITTSKLRIQSIDTLAILGWIIPTSD